MNRIDKVFKEKKDNILSVYFTAGYPALEDTMTILETLQESGADVVEIGIPFSDPVADGPTIQESNQIALRNGMTLKLLVQQLKRMREKIHIPVLLMGYLNPVMQYGVENFCKDMAEIGVDGLIIPDLPMKAYIKEFRPCFNNNGIHNIFLITPQTVEERIRFIDNESEGFIYMVSSASITGAKSGISKEQIGYFERVKAMNLSKPTLIGFGISDHSSFSTACQYSNGAIIGSAFVKLLGSSKNIRKDIKEYVEQVKGLQNLAV
jgi:tryptophan synthase alpha chain